MNLGLVGVGPLFNPLQGAMVKHPEQLGKDSDAINPSVGSCGLSW